LVKLTAGTLNLTGSILADGSSTSGGGYGGSGSGGGIWINAGTLSGSGTISAKGGIAITPTVDGGGGGGRIAIYYNSNSLPIANISAAGGKSGTTGSNPANNGGAGTIYLKDSAKAKGDLIINNNGIVTTNVTAVLGGDYGSLDVKGGAVLTVTGNMTFGTDMTITGSNLTFSGGITAPGNLTLDGCNISVVGAISVTGALTLKNGSVLSHYATTMTASYKLDVTAGSVNVDATSKIDVSGKGYLGAYQGGNNTTIGRTLGNTNTGGSTNDNGGSYGGLGGIGGGSVNATYGLINLPGELGSGGGGESTSYPGGNGGGYIKITTGALTLNGNILADGGSLAINGGGGGSGGSVHIIAGTLSGGGIISAQGGSAYPANTYYGAGGGGRIAIYYDGNSLPLANIIAAGGKSGNGTSPTKNGGAGTIYLKDTAKAKGDLIINNNGIVTTNVTAVLGGDYGSLDVKGGAVLTVTGNMTFGTDMTITGSNLTFSGGITAPGNLTLDGCNISVVGAISVTGALTLKNGSVLSHYATTMTASYKLDVTAGSVNVDATSKIDVSGKGYLGAYQGGNNTTIGRTLGNTNTGGSTNDNGGSYGGLGGIGGGSVNATYGLINLPGELGSGGGGESTSYPGGNGGGYIKITTGALTLNGNILADGGSLTINGGGGGSGGSVHIIAGTLSGGGIISAQGGSVYPANTYYGAGGGGRIAIYYDANSLPLANIIATGGKSGNGTSPTKNGGAGTIYLSQNVNPLTVTKSGTGSGIVQSTPSGITCGATCSGNFARSNSVTLTATPDSGSTFNGWSGSCTGLGDCMVTMDAAKAVTAIFTLNPPPTVSITSPSGITRNNRPLLQYAVSSGTIVVKIDGAVVTKTTGNTLDLLADGNHSVRVEATNNGVTGFAESPFTVDTIAPVVTVNAVPAIVKTATQTLSGTIEAGSNISVAATTGGATLGTITYPTATTWQCVASNLSVGTNSFTITAYDQAGNSSQVATSFTYALSVSLGLSTSTITADFQGVVVLTVSNIVPSGSEVQVEQYIDSNRNGVIDSGDYAIRSFKISDGIISGNSNLQGDEDGTANSTITTTLNCHLTNDLYHAPGHYIFKATKGTETTTIPFVVDPVSQLQTISGTITDGNILIPGATIRLLDKWQRPVTATIADDTGTYVINVKQPGDYILAPVVYGTVAPAVPITLLASQSIVNQTVTVIAGTYHVSGNLKDATTGNGIAGVWIQASDGNNNATAITNSTGVYDLLLPAGQYTLTAYNGVAGPGSYAKGYVGFNNQPLPITVNSTMAIPDITLLPGNILASGRVLDTTGNPVAGAPVTGRIRATNDVHEPVSNTISDAAGNYTLGLSSGTNWDISLDNGAAQTFGYLSTFHGDLSTTTGPLSGNDLTAYPITAWMQGTVKNSANLLLPGVEVRIRNTDSSIIASVLTAPDGTYRLGAFAGIWYIDALTENKGTHQVTEQTITLSDSQHATVDFTVDVTPPTVTIAPVTSPTKVTSQTITGTMEAGATTAVSVNTTASVGSVSYPTSTTWSCTITGLVEGPNALTITATDTAGNTTVVVASITLDTIAPTVVITSPTSGLSTTQIPLLTYTASDGSIVVKVDTLVVNKISGTTLDTLTSGSHTVRVEATDVAGNIGFASVTFTVNRPPSFSPTTISKPNATVGIAYSGQTITGTAIDPEGDAIAYSKVSGPAWLTVAANGTLSGTPTATDVGTNNFTIQAAATGGTGTATLTITVVANQPPAFSPTTISKPNATVGIAYSGQTIAGAAIDPEGDAITYSKISGPAWLTVAANGTLSGTPTATDVGTNSFTVQAAATGGTGTATLTITVVAAPVIVTQLNAWTTLYPTVPAGTTATNLAAGSFTLGSGTNRLLMVAVVMEIGTAANPAISASYGGIALTPVKVTANTQREIVWVGYLKDSQIGSGAKALTVTYSGATGNVSALHVKWSAFSNVNQITPVASSGGVNTNLTSATFGSAITYVANGMTTVVAGNGGTPATGTLTATPATPVFTADTAAINNAQTSRTYTTAAHTAAGSYASTSQVSWTGTTSAWSGVVVASLQPAIPNQPPAFSPTTISKPNATVGIAYSGQTITGTAIDPEGDAITYSKVSGPAWLTVAANGTLSGTPTATDVGTNNFTVQATATGGSGTATLTITVVANQPPSFSPGTISKANATVGVAYSGQTIAGAAIDPEGDAITYSKISGPAWLTVAANGTLSGTPTATDAGANSFTVQAAATGGTGTATLTITVVAAPVIVTQLNAWTTLYPTVPAGTTATNLAAGSFTLGSGTNRLLMVAVVMEIGTAANPAISASYGGIALTPVKVTANTQREIVWVGYLKDSQIGSGAKALTVTYSGATGNVSALHVKWSAFSNVNQITPVASSGGVNTNLTSATFGSAITYVANGMTTVVAGNGGTPATGTLTATPATPVFTADTAAINNAQTSRTYTTAAHTAAGSYASTSQVSWTGTTSAWSGVVAVSLQP
jgi:cytoskeletal protein CcmA (bactofilin family)